MQLWHPQTLLGELPPARKAEPATAPSKPPPFCLLRPKPKRLPSLWPTTPRTPKTPRTLAVPGGSSPQDDTPPIADEEDDPLGIGRSMQPPGRTSLSTPYLGWKPLGKARCPAQPPQPRTCRHEINAGEDSKNLSDSNRIQGADLKLRMPKVANGSDSSLPEGNMNSIVRILPYTAVLGIFQLPLTTLAEAEDMTLKERHVAKLPSGTLEGILGHGPYTRESSLASLLCPASRSLRRLGLPSSEGATPAGCLANLEALHPWSPLSLSALLLRSPSRKTQLSCEAPSARGTQCGMRTAQEAKANSLVK